MNVPARKEDAFTLIEVLIALAIISGALITIIYTVNYHLSLIERHEAITVATLLGREKILEVTDQQRDKAGTFPEPYQEFSYEIEIKDTPYDRIRLVRLSVMKGGEKIYLSRFVEKKS
ncbi:MAG: type IV pilus modification PilV family protein [bacterium]